MQLTFENAITIAQMDLNIMERFARNYILLPEHATETPYGWLIPWAQSDYRSTKEVKVGGNLPFFVDRFTGKISHKPLRQTYKVWLAAYAHEHGYTNSASDAALTPDEV